VPKVRRGLMGHIEGRNSGPHFDRRDVAALPVEVAVVDPFGGGEFDLLDAAPGASRLDQLVLYRPLIVSARALSWELPAALTDGWIPASAR
jgi:hypothetical protein